VRIGLLGRSVASGLILGLAFPPAELTFLAFVALVPLLAALEEIALSPREPVRGSWRGPGFLCGYAAGLAFFGPLLWWIALLDAPALTIPWVRVPATAAIVGAYSLLPGLFGLAFVAIRRRVGAPVWLIAPALWTCWEVLRGVGPLAFPWGELGYSQVTFLPALQIAAVAGVHGITLWLALANGLAFASIRGGRLRAAPVVAFLLVVLCPVALGVIRLARPLSNPTLRVALVQPSVGNAEKWDPQQREDIFRDLFELSRAGIAQGAELVIWAETAAPCYLLKDYVYRPFVEQLAAETGVPILLGLPDYQVTPEKRVTYTNTAVLFDARGELAGRMDKMHLVPFGEYIPLSGHISALQRLDFGEADFVSGKKFVLFELGDRRLAVLICFEAIFPEMSRRYVREGADLLVNITNDSWFGAGAGARQHALMAVARCAETGCGLARCANSGISLAADPRGRILLATGLFTSEVAVVDVPLRRGETIYAKLGDWPVWLASAAALGLLGAALWRRPRLPREPGC
jgi:apolipoprotein N-acyltransferase